MASDNSSQELEGALIEGEQDAAALALEVKALRALLEQLQADLGPAVQSSLRERSTELQRAGADIAERQDRIERLQADLAAAETRAAGLEDEAARWRDAARRGLDEISERARQAQATYELQTAELGQALTAAKARLEVVRGETERSQRQVRSLRAKVVRRERRHMQMTRSLSWRITAPLRWMTRPLGRLLLAGARLRRRLMKRPGR
jgi:chromosome segregation ATPase